MATAVPAGLLGLSDRGALAVGRRADILVADPDLRPRAVVVAGVRRENGG
jgi:N-acetylglucosamine-6-phosphate deacetylase